MRTASADLCVSVPGLPQHRGRAQGRARGRHRVLARADSEERRPHVLLRCLTYLDIFSSQNILFNHNTKQKLYIDIILG